MPTVCKGFKNTSSPDFSNCIHTLKSPTMQMRNQNLICVVLVCQATFHSGM